MGQGNERRNKSQLGMRTLDKIKNTGKKRKFAGKSTEGAIRKGSKQILYYKQIGKYRKTTKKIVWCLRTEQATELKLSR